MTTPSTEQALERIRGIVSDVLRVSPDTIHLESRFTEDLGADSLDKITLLMALEDEFGTPISDEQAESLTTVDAVVALVCQSTGTSA
jgi:acyl carrier protein